MKNTGFILKLAAILFAIAFVCSLILVVCNNVTEPVILKLQEETEEAAKKDVLPEADGGFEEITAIKAEGITNIYSGKDKNGNVVGYCFKADPSGFGGKVQLIVGVNANGEVTGVNITEMSETPGLGANANNKEWLSQFVGKNGEITVVKTGNAKDNEINAISGATITSKAVSRGVNNALNAANQLFGKEAK